MEDRKFIIYKHTNKINGKIYFGLTSQKPNDRWQWGHGYKGSPRFYNAIKKYGWKNFDHEILFENLTEQEAKEKETQLILEYKTNNDKFGYNLTNGGEYNQMNEEIKQKISRTQKKIMGNGGRGQNKEFKR